MFCWNWVRTMGSSNISNRITQVNKALKDLLAMVWDFKTLLNNPQGLSTAQVTLLQVLCLHYNREIFQELTQLWLRDPLVSQSTPAALCSTCFWKNEIKIFLPPESLTAPVQLPGRSPSPAWNEGTQRGPEHLQRHKQAWERGSILPKKGSFRGIAPKHVAGQVFILSNISIFLPSKPDFWSATQSIPEVRF